MGAIVVALGMLPTCVTMGGVLPVGTRIAAPLVCPSSTARSEVVSRWGGSSRGGRSLKWDLYCLSEHGHGTIPSTPKLFLAVLAVWTAIASALLLGWVGVRRIRTRNAVGGPDVA